METPSPSPPKVAEGGTPGAHMENGTQRQSGAGSPAPETNFDDVDTFSEASFYSCLSPRAQNFEELEDLHFRHIMPIHAQSEDSISEIEV